MAGGVVEHEVHVEVDGYVLVDCLQELQELDRAVALVQRSDHLPALDVQRRVQAVGAVPLVVVRRALWRAWEHRQRGRCAIKRFGSGSFRPRTGRRRARAGSGTPAGH